MSVGQAESLSYTSLATTIRLRASAIPSDKNRGRSFDQQCNSLDLRAVVRCDLLFRGNLEGVSGKVLLINDEICATLAPRRRNEQPIMPEPAHRTADGPAGGVINARENVISDAQLSEKSGGGEINDFALRDVNRKQRSLGSRTQRLQADVVLGLGLCGLTLATRIDRRQIWFVPSGSSRIRT
jgi:hypothetical protein